MEQRKNQFVIKGLFEYLASGKFKLLFSLIGSVLLFREFLVSVFNKKIVDGILSIVLPHWSIDLLMLAAFLILLAITCYFIYIRKKVSNFALIFSLVSLLIYTYYRLFSTEYIFYRFKIDWLKSFAYTDLLVLVLISAVIIRVWDLTLKADTPNYKSKPFLIDTPIFDVGDDLLGRKDFAKEIAERIQSKAEPENAGALAIGINGSWGSGKTSFVNMIKGLIDKKGRIIIDFHPWRSSSSEKIIEDYFNLVISELKQFDSSLSTEMVKYAKSISKLDDNIFNKSLDTVIDYLFESPGRNALYEKVNAAIKKAKKQIIICIDDLDRLDKKEVVEVLRLIRNTANFNSVTYVVSYDKNYVLEAIKDFNSYNSSSFLEKIFQFEFVLPVYEHTIKRNAIKQALKKQLSNEYHATIDKVVDFVWKGVNFTNEFVETYRDVIRFANSLCFEISFVKDNIVFYDFYMIQLVKLKHPEVYAQLFTRRREFFTSDPTPSRQNGNQYDFKRDKTVKVNEEGWGFTNTYFSKYLNSIKLSSRKQLLLCQLINSLFERTDLDNDFGNYKAFRHIGSFHKYFSLRLFDGDIDSVEFEKYCKGDYLEYRKRIMGWVDENRIDKLYDLLKSKKNFSSVVDFENHVRILFWIENNVFAARNVFGDSISWLIEAVLFKSVKYYRSVEDCKSFLERVLSLEDELDLFQSIFIRKIVTSGLYKNESIIVKFERDQLLDINFKNFEKYFEKTRRIDSYFWQFYHACRIDVSNESERSKADEMCILCLVEEATANDLSVFIEPVDFDNTSYRLGSLWKKLFENPKNFEKCLDLCKMINRTSDEFKEFLKFYNLSVNAIQFEVKFQFDVIKGINKWSN